MTDNPHVTAAFAAFAAFINNIAEEGSKAEAIEWLQKLWNEMSALDAEIERLEIERLRSRITELEKLREEYFAENTKLVSEIDDQDAKIAEIERLRTQSQELYRVSMKHGYDLMEREAENEILKKSLMDCQKRLKGAGMLGADEELF